MTEYPAPAYAANIWITGDTVWLGLPPEGEGTKGHSVPFPATEKGLTLLIETLKARSRGKRRLSEEGSPTRWDIEKAMKRDKQYLELIRRMQGPTEEEREESIRFLADLGL